MYKKCANEVPYGTAESAGHLVFLKVHCGRSNTRRMIMQPVMRILVAYRLIMMLLVLDEVVLSTERCDGNNAAVFGY